MQPDGFFRRLVSPVTGTPRQYQFMARSYTLADSADVANNVTSIAANYLATSNGTNLVARNLFDNNTYVGVLNNKPFSLGQWTTAGRPAGTSGYMGWNTTLTGIDWYNGMRWSTGLESTFARGTSSYVPFFNANGQVTQDAGFAYDGTSDYIFLNTNGTGEAGITFDALGSGNAGRITYTGTQAYTPGLIISSNKYVQVASTPTGNYVTYNTGNPTAYGGNPAIINSYLTISIVTHLHRDPPKQRGFGV